MSQEVVCPTCGGFIFSPDEEVMKLSPCTCTGGDSSSSTIGDSAYLPVEVSRPASSAMAALASVAAAKPPAMRSVAKVCCNCGKDVNGHRRMKDSQGRYWCYKCGKADEQTRLAAQQAGKEACKQCGTLVLVQDLQLYEGTFICPKCYREKKEDEKATEARIARINRSFAGSEKKRIIPLLVILGILMFIILLRTVGLIGSK